MASERRLRLGIDVGGTFTDAVAVDSATRELLASVKIPTTHTAPEGVAAGIAAALTALLARVGLPAAQVSFIAHGTTQATNALLEGDLARVGIVAAGSGLEGARVRSETDLGRLELSAERSVELPHRFIAPGDEAAAVAELAAAGVEVIVAAAAFSVDDPSGEQAITATAQAAGLPAVATHEMTQLLGLRRRTRTAAVNAGILPVMVRAADQTEASVRAAGIGAPLMVMRCDGGVMSVEQLRRRPLLTLLSGPAAGVAGALRAERLSDGLFIEVGGTSSDLCAVAGGRVATGDALVGGQSLAVPALDIRTLGVAGGSLPRVGGRRVTAVGPRSAHIAGLDYVCFADAADADPAALAAARLVTFAPRPGDPADYACLELPDGRRLGLTLTCAAVALGLVPAEAYAYAPPAAARAGLAPLAAAFAVSVDEAARQIVDAAVAQVRPTAEALIAAAGLDRRDVTLVAGGGGGAVVVAPLAAALGLPWKLAAHHEVISPLGVALALVRETVERTIVPPLSEEVLLALRAEARAAAVASGALAETVEVEVDVDPTRNVARAVASGAGEVRAGAGGPELDEAALLAAAARELRLDAPTLRASCGRLRVFVGTEQRRAWLGLVRRTVERGGVLDVEGVVRQRFESAEIARATASTALSTLSEIMARLTTYDAGGGLPPAATLLVEDRLVDLAGLTSAEAIVALARAELSEAPADAPAVVIAWARH